MLTDQKSMTVCSDLNHKGSKETRQHLHPRKIGCVLSSRGPHGLHFQSVFLDVPLKMKFHVPRGGGGVGPKKKKTIIK